jgi:hypothetical protein
MDIYETNPSFTNDTRAQIDTATTEAQLTATDARLLAELIKTGVGHNKRR